MTDHHDRLDSQSPSQTIGPMYGFALYDETLNQSVDPSDPNAIRVQGHIFDGDGEPLAHPDALVELWHGAQFVRARTDAFGLWSATLSRPPEGETLEDGTPLAPYLHVTVWARGLLKQAETRLYFPEAVQANAADPILSRVPEDRRPLLVADIENGAYVFDVHLQGEKETPFFGF